MAFNVSALADYTIQNVDILIHRSLFNAKTMQVIEAEGNVMTGVKSAETINQLATDAIFQVGGTCGFLSSGNTAFTQRTLTVGKIKVNESLCPEALEPKYTQLALKKGSYYDMIAFAQDYSELKADTMAEQLETAAWQGDTTSLNVNLNKFDGFIKIIDAGSGVTQSNVAAYTAGGPISAATGITISNAFAVVNGLILAMPATIQGKKDVRIFCGWDTFSKYIANLVNLNLFHYAPVGTEVSNEANGEIIIPGTQYKLTAVHGLDGTNRLFGMRVSNMWLGVDLLNDFENWQLFYAKEAQEVRFVAQFKEGVQVGFPNEITKFTLA